MQILRQNKTVNIGLQITLGVIMLIGLIGLFKTETRDFFISKTPYLLIACTIAILFYHEKMNLQSILIFCGIIIGGLIIEIVGVNTGYPFGNYWYNRTLGIQLFKTPLIIGLNWFILSYCVYFFLLSYKLSIWTLCSTGALILTVYDLLLIEPFAIKFGLWEWAHIAVPMMNYGGWLISSWVFMFIYAKTDIIKANTIATPILIMLTAFFTFSIIIA